MVVVGWDSVVVEGWSSCLLFGFVLVVDRGVDFGKFCRKLDLTGQVQALALTREDVTNTQDSLAVTVRAEHSKTHRGRTVPMLDSRCRWFWLERIKTIDPSDPLIPAQGDTHSHWRTDNAVKACAALYKDIGVQLEDQAISSMRSHAWRTVLINRAIARGVPAEIRSASFGHTEAMNARNHTDLTDVSAMQSALEDGALDGALEG